MSCTRMRSPESVMDEQGNKFEGPSLHASYDVGGQPWHLVSDANGPRILRPNMIDAGVYVTATENIPEQIEKDFNDGPEPIDFTAPEETPQPAAGASEGNGSGDGDASSTEASGDGTGSTGENASDDGKATETEGASA